MMLQAAMVQRMQTHCCSATDEHGAQSRKAREAKREGCSPNHAAPTMRYHRMGKRRMVRLTRPGLPTP